MVDQERGGVGRGSDMVDQETYVDGRRRVSEGGGACLNGCRTSQIYHPATSHTVCTSTHQHTSFECMQHSHSCATHLQLSEALPRDLHLCDSIQGGF